MSALRKMDRNGRGGPGPPIGHMMNYAQEEKDGTDSPPPKDEGPPTSTLNNIFNIFKYRRWGKVHEENSFWLWQKIPFIYEYTTCVLVSTKMALWPSPCSEICSREEEGASIFYSGNGPAGRRRRRRNKAEAEGPRVPRQCRCCFSTMTVCVHMYCIACLQKRASIRGEEACICRKFPAPCSVLPERERAERREERERREGAP